jgi:hypothetical protein
MSSNWGHVYGNEFVVLDTGLDLFRLGATATGGKMKPPRIFSLRR